MIKFNLLYKFFLILLCIGCYKPKIFPIDSTVSTDPSGVITVQPKETLFSLAKDFNISVNQLSQHNHLSAAAYLRVGQKLKIPNTKIVISKNATLSAMSKAYNMSLASILRLNHLHKNAMIKSGDIIAIPGLVSQPKNITIKTTDSGYRVSNSSKKTGRFLWPLEGKVIEGASPHSASHGIFIEPQATKRSVLAAQAGEVVYFGGDIKGLGKMILIRHKNNLITAYANIGKSVVTTGQIVQKGEKIGILNPASCLYFELRRNAEPINPIPYLKA